MEPDNTFSDKRIGILGKGGSGKSTTTVLLAKAVRDSGYQVCVLDADSTNTGMDWIFTVVDPTTTSIRLVGDVQDLISRIRAGEPPATEHLENAGLVEKTRKIYREAAGIIEKLEEAFQTSVA